MAMGEEVIVSYGGFGMSEDEVGFGVSTYSVSNALDFNSDNITNIYFCSPDSQFICVSGQHISFSMPRDAKDFTKKWKYQGRVFNFKERIVRSIPDGTIRGRSYTWNLGGMGREEKVYVITRSKNKDDYDRVVFLYSMDNGLVGYISETEYGTSQHWLSSGKGFGHASITSAAPKKAYISARDEPAYQP